MTQNQIIGEKVVEFFKLKAGYGFMEDRFDCYGGSKTIEGIGASIVRIVEEAKEVKG